MWVPPRREGHGFRQLHGEAAAWRQVAAMARATGFERISSERVRTCELERFSALCPLPRVCEAL